MEINTRELVFDILLEMEQTHRQSHIIIAGVLSKYQFLPKEDRAFITRLSEGTTERRITLDFCLNLYAKVKVNRMKPAIRTILRMALYQILYMDHIPDHSAVDEAVKLTEKRSFKEFKGFVNGILRTVLRNKDSIPYPDRKKKSLYLSVKYSVPQLMADDFIKAFGFATGEKIFASYLEVLPTTVRLVRTNRDVEETLLSLNDEGVTVKAAPFSEDARYIEDYDYLMSLSAFRDGGITVQDVSSMLVADIAAPKAGDYCLDLCAAPGGKSLHLADKLLGSGHVTARDISPEKIDRINENIDRMGFLNISTEVKDAAIFHADDAETADIVLVDAPCTGYGVIGKKSEIKYGYSREGQAELVGLQRSILKNAASYVKKGGTLIYSTCTIGSAENEDNVKWFLENFSFETESLDPYLPPELCGAYTRSGRLQLLPGIHPCDGFFIARFIKKG